MMVCVVNMKEHIKITFLVREIGSVQLPYKKSKQTMAAKSLESGIPTEKNKLQKHYCVLSRR